MAQFTVGGSLKSLFNGDGFPNGFDSPCRPIKVKALRRGGRSSRFKTLFSVPRERKIKLSLVRAMASDDSGSSLSEGRRINSNEVFDEIMDEDTEFEIDELEGFRGLVVDVSYRPVNVVCWKRAICLEFMDKADVLEYYDQTINSPSGSYYIPAVLRVQHLLQVRRRKVKTGLSRKSIFHRDNFLCQYCSSRENLTIDHVLPISRGGKWTWENLVAACQKCNSKKGQKTLEEANMKLMKIPKAPKDYDILAIPVTNHAIRMLKMRKGMPEEWRQYLSNTHGAP